MSIDGINSLPSQFPSSASSMLQGARRNRFTGSGTHEDALQREISKANEEQKAQEEAQAHLSASQKSGIDYVKEYIKSYGSPEDLDHNPNAFMDTTLKDGIDPNKSRYIHPLAFQNIVQITQDPNDEGKFTVTTTSVDGSGHGKVSSVAKFDSGDGEDRSQLTPARKKAAKAYQKAAAAGSEQAQDTQGSVTSDSDATDKATDK